MANYDIYIFLNIVEYSCLKEAGEHFQEGMLGAQCSPPYLSTLV